MQHNNIRKSGIISALILSVLINVAQSQTIVTSGAASYASQPPAYKSKTDQHDGYNAGLMMTRGIFCDEQEGRPIDTNNWWTDIINNKYSGALWSYPAMLHTGDYGVRVSYPSYWADEGKEMKSKSSLTISALSFTPEAAIAADWHDLDVTFRMPDKRNSNSEMRVTMAHGMPFTWVEYTNITPAISPSDEAEIFGEDSKKGRCGIKIGEDLYALYYPSGVRLKQNKTGYILEDAEWVVAALLTAESDLERFAPYATGVVEDSKVSWYYNEQSGTVSTDWNITTRDLRREGNTTPVMMGLLPHVYKYSTVIPPQLDNISYSTPRGEMRMYADNTGHFNFSYPFSGMLPYYAMPQEDNQKESGFKEDVMRTLMQNYADKGSFGTDTYWGGKGLVQMALNMTFAKMSHQKDIYQKSREKLKDALVNWLTYTPGEESMFFSYYPRWGAMLGFNVSYDSDAFNDHHFHYGYFIYAAALLCMEDYEFAAGYGEILKMIAKDYANYDHADTRFPFMRTLDPWSGHSWAGGMGDAGNDNGNGQESTSEAMQSWGGLYLLGVALNDKEMRDAGIWGWSTEARATREYWFDVDAPRPSNEGGREAWPGKGAKIGNYDYSQYKYAYNSNITGKGIGWWTWFGGDPLFMHGIQWMPVSPALDYLSWDNDFVDWAYRDMMKGANSSFSHQWFEPTLNSDNGEQIQPLADNDWGNVTLAYMQRSRPEEAADIFSKALKEERHLATSISTSHISYYLIHNHLTYGDIDFSMHADIPTANAFLKNGEYTYIVYNPAEEERIVNFYRNGVVVKSVVAPGARLTAFSTDPMASEIQVSCAQSILPPGGKGDLCVKVLDQYGATAKNDNPIIFSSNVAGVSVSKAGEVSVGANVKKGTKVEIKAISGALEGKCEFIVNDPAVYVSYKIEGLPKYIEKGARLPLQLLATDQYGTENIIPVAEWHLISDKGNEIIPSDYIVRSAGKYSLEAVPDKKLSLPNYSEEIVVMPSLSNVALKAKAYSSSEENVGSVTKNVNDGEDGTRWGSKHSENEWILLDFGEETYLTDVIVNWEAAYGADYDFQIAPANAVLTNFTGSYVDGNKSIKVPLENEWTTIAEVRGNSSAGRVTTHLNASGRYLRLKGVRRGSNYGYSIYEISARGLPLSISESEAVGIDFDLPEVMNEGETVILTPRAFTTTGASSEVKVDWSADKDAVFEGNLFTPLNYGIYQIIGSTHAGLRGTAQIFVNESERMSAISLSAESLQGLVNEDVSLRLMVKNQFGGEITPQQGVIKVNITDANTGEEVKEEVAKYDWRLGKFRAFCKGDYKICVNDTMASANIRILDISEANLALVGAASASSAMGGNDAANINDGSIATRWESTHKDAQWVEIDFDTPFIINKHILNWEGAYANDYSIAISLNGDKWWNVYSQKSGKGGYEIIQHPDMPAKMVRLECNKRATAWGNSLHEWEIYGQARYEVSNDGQAPDMIQFEVLPGNGDVIINFAATDNCSYVFNKFQLLYPSGRVAEEVTAVVASGDNCYCKFENLLPETKYTLKVQSEDASGNVAEYVQSFDSYLDLTGKNIALGKTAMASSAENVGLEANNAVDGEKSTRWGSKFEDNQSLTVDLGNVYSLSQIKIYWDDTAYATDYIVECSENGEDFFSLYERAGWKGAVSVDACRLDNYDVEGKCYARYVRVTGIRRATQYGSSIRELEVYADNDFLHTLVSSLYPNDVSQNLEGVYNLQGVKIRDNDKEMRTFPLPPGIYIINGTKTMVK